MRAPELAVDPVLVGGLLVEHVVGLGHEGGLGHGPLVRREQQDVGAAAVHLVRLTRVDGLLLHRLNLQRIQLLPPTRTRVSAIRRVFLDPLISDCEAGTAKLVRCVQR